jgi:hypothetical protein
MSIVNVGTANIAEKLNLPQYTTAQRSALSATAGNMIWNTDKFCVEFWTGVEWKELGQKGGSLYTFTSFTFLPIVAAGSNVGPTLTQIQSAYASTSWAGTYITMGSLQGYQRWTVPKDGSYTIIAGGAAGGKDPNTSFSRAFGATITGTFALSKSDVIEIVVGSKGAEYGSPHYNEMGGGGGTFVRNNTTNTLLLVAGGAGGAPSSAYGASCSRNISNGHGQSGTTPGNEGCYSSAGAASGGNGGFTAGSYQGGAGGGYNSAGASGGTHCCLATGGGSYLTGLIGGLGNCCYSTQTQGCGGFGGGGGGMLSGPGGGGGYNGGSCSGYWSSHSAYGGGGSSYNVGTAASATSGSNNTTLGGYEGAGYCKITLN